MRCALEHLYPPCEPPPPSAIDLKACTLRTDMIMGTTLMKLTIVIPAYNEEDAIGSTIERTVAARESIVNSSPIDDVEVIVVSDGSTDRTVEIASACSNIRVIVFPKNRGYGAAIKKGFEVGSGDVVGFLDGDGTCDPNFFGDLCTALIEQNASVAIGSRMGPESHMPRIRRLGNRIYALILSALSNRVVTDTASGMRVIRRDTLEQIYPLPDGLHFTPAMSARVLMSDQLSIVEQPMTYEERVGESKLHVVKDGVRFLRTILEMTLMWRPATLFVATAIVCLGLMTAFGLHPIETWVRSGSLKEDMIYRLLFCLLMGTIGVTCMAAAVVAEHLHRMLNDRRSPRTFVWNVIDKLYGTVGIAVQSAIGLPLVGWLIGRGAWSWITQGFVDAHWSRVVLAGLVVFTLIQSIATALTINLLKFHTARSSLHRRHHATEPVSAAATTIQPTPTAAPHVAAISAEQA